jgi:hypothetical protein
MTSEEIKHKAAFDLSTNGWLKEICLQLALLNEKSTDQSAAQVHTLAEAGIVFTLPEPERVKRAYTKRK